MARQITALIRHGDYEQPERVPSAHLPHGLTATGERQAMDCADELLEWAAAEGLDIHPVIDSSTLLRAWQTADLIGRRLAERTGATYEVESFDDLCERCVGSMANLSVEEIEAIIDRDPRLETPPRGWKSSSGYRLPFPGAESLLEAGQRVADHVLARNGVAQSAGSRDCVRVFVGHGAAIRHAALTLGILTQEDIPLLSMHHCRPVFLESGADGWRHVGGEWKVRPVRPTRFD